VSSLTWPSSSALNRIAAPIADIVVGGYCLKGRVKKKTPGLCCVICSYCLPLLALHVTKRIVQRSFGGRYGERTAASGGDTHCRWLGAPNTRSCFSLRCMFLAGPFVLYVNMQSRANVSKVFFLFRTGNASKQGDGLLIVGPSDAGKTAICFSVSHISILIQTGN
jgi:hypothetical protein